MLVDPGFDFFFLLLFLVEAFIFAIAWIFSKYEHDKITLQTSKRSSTTFPFIEKSRGKKNP